MTQEKKSLLLMTSKIIGMRAGIKLNDIWIVREFAYQPVNSQSKIALQAVNGANHLEIFASPLPPQTKGAEVSKFGTDALISIKVHEVDTESRSEELLFEFEWKPEPSSIDPTLVQILSEYLDFEEQSEKIWQEGTRFPELSREVKRDIFEQLRAFESALAERNVDAVIEFQRAALSNGVTAMGGDLETTIGSYLEFLSSMMNENWRVDAFEPGKITFDLMANGRIVHPTRDDFGPIIRTTNGEEQFMIDPYYAQINGEWVIVI